MRSPPEVEVLKVSRGRPYSTEEDAILLQTAGMSGHDTNELLRGAGFEERSENAIKARRHELRKRVTSANGSSDPITGLVTRRAKLEREIAVCRARLSELEAEAAEVRTELFKLVATEAAEDHGTDLASILSGLEKPRTKN